MESVFENATLDALAQFFPPSFVSTMLDGFETAVNDNYGKYVACVVVPFSMTQVITYVCMISLWHMTQTCMLIPSYIAVCTYNNRKHYRHCTNLLSYSTGSSILKFFVEYQVTPKNGQSINQSMSLDDHRLID